MATLRGGGPALGRRSVATHDSVFRRVRLRRHDARPGGGRIGSATAGHDRHPSVAGPARPWNRRPPFCWSAPSPSIRPASPWSTCRLDSRSRGNRVARCWRSLPDCRRRRFHPPRLERLNGCSPNCGAGRWRPHFRRMPACSDAARDYWSAASRRRSPVQGRLSPDRRSMGRSLYLCACRGMAGVWSLLSAGPAGLSHPREINSPAIPSRRIADIARRRLIAMAFRRFRT